MYLLLNITKVFIIIIIILFLIQLQIGSSNDAS